jgi:biotin carboxyl carrier protein
LAPPDVDSATPIAGAHAHGIILAPMPGTVLGVDVAVGDAVTPQQRLVVLEAMKMEMPVLAPFAATVTAVHVEPGDQIAAGTLLVELG